MGRLFFVALMTASLESQKSNDMATNSIGLTDNRNMQAVLIATGCCKIRTALRLKPSTRATSPKSK